jgi:Family of unknown function (DUF6064)
MKLPFTVEQFSDVFKHYNQSVFPMQIVFYFLAFTVIYLSIKQRSYSHRIINAILSFFWLWMGIVYHLLFFAQINKAAYFFGVIFILQAVLFFYQGVLYNKLSYKFRSDKFGWAGAILMLFALFIYPGLSYVFKHVYPASPTFGLPCPTTIFTFGILLCSARKISFSILVIPFIWSVVGFFAALQLGVVEDTGLLVAGIAGLMMIALKNKKQIFSPV